MRVLARLLLTCFAVLSIASVAVADKPADKPTPPGQAKDGVTDPVADAGPGNSDKAKADKPEKPEKAAKPEKPGQGLSELAQAGGPVNEAATELGRTMGANTVGGRILVKTPGSDDFAEIPADEPVPVGSTVDATEGLVQIMTEADGGVEQEAVVSGAVFTVQQAASEGGVTDLVLQGGDFSDCGAGARGKATARAAGAPKPGKGQVARGLWAAGKGKFRTKGRFGTAAVRGTRWATVDRCNSTTVKVFDGVVDVTDHGTGKTVAVRAGERRVVSKPGVRR